MPATIAYVAGSLIASVGGAAVANSALLPIVTTVIGWAGTAGLVVAASKFAQPNIPRQRVETPLKASFSPRRSAFGEVRVSGIYVLFEAKEKTSYDVLAVLDGLSAGVTHYYLHDDEVTVDEGNHGVYAPDGRKYAYGDGHDRVFFEYRLGENDPDAYAKPVAAGIWTEAHKGVGVTSIALTCKQSKRKHQQEDFPNGVPAPSVAVKAQIVPDPRGGEAWSDNPACCLMAYLTTAAGGMGLDYERRIQPTLAYWQAAADDCDRIMGDGFARYRCSGVYEHTTAPTEVIGNIVSACDGWLGQRGDGALIFRSGVYEPPTVAIDDIHVISEEVRWHQPDEEAVNELVVSFTNPEIKFQEDQAGDPVRDEADIAARGKARSEPLALDWVFHAAQARRLARRRLSRSTAEMRGMTRTNLYGLNVLGERYIRRRSLENPALANRVFEVESLEIDLASMTVAIHWVLADPCIDECADDEPGVDEPPTRPVPGVLTAPTIASLSIVYAPVSGSGTGARIEIEAEGGDDEGEWIIRYRVGGGGWVTMEDTDADSATPTLSTGFVDAIGEIEVQVAYRTAGGTSAWSDSSFVTTAAPEDPEPVFIEFSGALDGVTLGEAGKVFLAGEDVTLPADLDGTVGVFTGTPPATAALVFELRIDGVAVGEMGLSLGGVVSFSLDATSPPDDIVIPAGQLFEVIWPVDLDGAEGVLTFSIKGYR